MCVRREKKHFGAWNFQIFKMRRRIFRIKRDTHTREKKDGLKTESGNQWMEFRHQHWTLYDTIDTHRNDSKCGGGGGFLLCNRPRFVNEILYLNTRIIIIHAHTTTLCWEYKSISPSCVVATFWKILNLANRVWTAAKNDESQGKMNTN
jgi:hypothetical protein